METRYQVIFWRKALEQSPVAEWMKEREPSDRKYIGDLLRDLAYDGPSSRPKVFKHMGGGLWEIRDLRHPGPGFRVYFGFDGDTIVVVVAAGDKSSQRRDIETARLRLKMDT